MKHSLPVTVTLLMLFLSAQVLGLSLLYFSQNIEHQDGQTIVHYDDTAIGERPALAGGNSLLFLVIGVGIGTALLLFLIKLRAFGLWKIWFLVAVWLSVAIALGVVIPAIWAMVIALILATWKIQWPNPIVHNLTEVLMYAGLAVLLVPLFDLFWMFILLLVISIYDMIAVWQSKHMVTLAKAQIEHRLFAGLHVPKTLKQPKKLVAPIPPGKGAGAAILGGGDIAFPLLFAGVVLRWCVEKGLSAPSALIIVMLVPLMTTVALALLFAYSKKERFYPAMPFISAGCVLGFGLIWAIV